MTASFKVYFPVRYKGPFDRRRARLNFAAVLAAFGEGVTITALEADPNWRHLADGDRAATQWGEGTPGRTDGLAVPVAAPWEAFSVETIGFGTTYVDFWVDGGALGATYVVSAGVILSNGERVTRSAAITIAFT